MQNMMLQLNVPGNMIQQTQSQSASKSGKTAKKDHDFRDLLENSSGKDVAKETSSKKADEDGVYSKTESAEKTDDAKLQKTQDGTEKKPDSAGKKEEAEVDADAQTLQFLMIGNSALETLQVISVQPDAFVQLQPVTDDAQPLAVGVLTDDVQTEWVPEENFSVQTVAEDAAGTVQSVPTDTMAKTQSQTEAVQQTGKLRNSQTSEEKTGKTEVQPHVQESVKKTVWQADSRGNQGQEKTAGEETEHFGAQTYAAETVFRQDAFGIHAQEGTAPTVHIQAGSPQELMTQLLDQLKAKASLGNQEFEIQIHPENLGKMAIKVAYTLEKVSISIVCTNEKTMEMLSAGAKNIAQIMEENLGSPTTVVVEQGEDNYLEQYNNQENSRQQQQEAEQERKQAPEESHQDFLQQLRLGLI